MQTLEQNRHRLKKFDISLIEFDEDEQIVCEIRKHPFGLFLIYLTGFLVALTILAAGVYSSVWLDKSGDQVSAGADNFAWVATAAAIFLSVLVGLVTLVSGYIYRSNVVLVTSEKIAQVLYRTIFDRKISQLSIGDVQDVTVSQNGLFARVFNYGTIVIETAGEQQNYTFTFAPDPYLHSKNIVSAHESNVKQFGN